MGWKWIVQDPFPIHVYHNTLWESQFHPNFYKKFQGVMLPIHKEVYNRTTPRFSKEAEVDIFPVARWFGEETFIYIRVFGSTALPTNYIPDKLLATQIAYQIAGEGG